ncbi:MAG: queuosine precursor transporter [Candidatus Kapaibacterium sp.]
MMTRGGRIFVLLNAFFIGFLILAELFGAKLFDVDVAWTGIFPAIGENTLAMTLGVIPFPVTFIITDLLNEYYGRKSVRFTTLLGMSVLVGVYLMIFAVRGISANEISPVSDDAFNAVFANSQAIIIGSVIAYLVGQLIDIQVFHRLRTLTGGRHIWLRATGSTIISQLIDSFIVIYLGLGLFAANPIGFDAATEIARNNFIFKMLVAITITPLIYLGHKLIDKHLGAEAEHLRNRAKDGEPFVTPFSPG